MTWIKTVRMDDDESRQERDGSTAQALSGRIRYARPSRE